MTRLRPPRHDEDLLLEQWRRDTRSEFEDFSGEQPPGVSGEPVPKPVGWGTLVVTDAHDDPVGDVTWRQVFYGPNPGSVALEIGISVRPEARGQGHGARAQRLLADYLFTTFGVHRVQATTDVDNVPERRALERAGFTLEGVVRGAQWRGGAFHDLALYGRVRDDG